MENSLTYFVCLFSKGKSVSLSLSRIYGDTDLFKNENVNKKLIVESWGNDLQDILIFAWEPTIFYQFYTHAKYMSTNKLTLKPFTIAGPLSLNYACVLIGFMFRVVGHDFPGLQTTRIAKYLKALYTFCIMLLCLFFISVLWLGGWIW